MGLVSDGARRNKGDNMTAKLWIVGSLTGMYAGENAADALQSALVDAGYTPGTEDYDAVAEGWDVAEATSLDIARALRCGSVIREEIEDNENVVFGRVTTKGEHHGALVVMWPGADRCAIDTNGNPLWGGRCYRYYDGGGIWATRLDETDDAGQEIYLRYRLLDLTRGLAV